MFILAACTATDTESVETTQDADEAVDTTESTDSDEVDEDVQPEGEAVSITMLTTSTDYDPLRNAASLLVAESWRELGINVEVEAIGDLTTYLDVLRNRNEEWDAAVFGLASRPERLDPHVMMYPNLHSSEAETGGNNFTGYSDPEMDELLDAQAAETDTEARREIVYDAQLKLMEDAPLIVLYNIVGMYPYNSALFDGVVPMAGFGLFNEWTLTEVEPLTSSETFVVAHQSDITSLNPLAENQTEGQQNLRLIYDTLTKIGPDGDVQPWAVESWEHVDETTVRLNLRPDMTFHDGEPVTSDDVVFSLTLMRDLGEPASIAGNLAEISSVDAIDDLTVDISLANPFPPLPVALSQAYILPAHIWQDVVDDPELSTPTDFANDEPVGSGPFVFSAYRPGERLALDRNAEHFRAPNVDYVYRVHTSQDAVFNAVRLQEAHTTTHRLTPSFVEPAEELEHVEVVEAPDFGSFHIYFDTRTSPFDDVELRRALRHTIPFDPIVNQVLQGMGAPGRGLIAPANEFWHNPETEQIFQEDYSYNLDTARAQLEEAGYTWNDSGELLAPSG